MAQRSVWGATTIDRPAETVRNDVNVSTLDILVRCICRFLWAWRVELSWLGLIAGIWFGLSRVIGPVWAGLTEAVLLGSLLWRPRVHKWAWNVLKRRTVHRAWVVSCRYARLRNASDRLPVIRKLETTKAGYRVSVLLPPGLPVEEMKLAEEDLAHELSAHGVKTQRVIVSKAGERADLATIAIQQRDVFLEMGPLSSPLLNAERTSLWDPIPIGINGEGELVKLELVFSNFLIGGEPGGGKSVTLQNIVAAAALDPECKLYLFDGKQKIELGPWEDSAEVVCGASVEEAIGLLKVLEAEMMDRYELMAQEARRQQTIVRKVAREMALPLKVIIIDELAEFTMQPKLGAEFSELCRSIVSLARATGFIFVGTTQKPSAKIIPTELRDNIAYRCALRCTNDDASDTILGRGTAKDGYSAADIDGASKGVGWLLTEGGQPQLFKSFFIPDPDLFALTQKAAALRGKVTRIDPVVSKQSEGKIIVSNKLFG